MLVNHFNLRLCIKIAGKEESKLLNGVVEKENESQPAHIEKSVRNCISRCFRHLKKKKKILWVLSFVTCTCICALMIWVFIYHVSKNQPKEPSQNPVQEWYKKESVYEILIQSFQDSSNNGIGDIKGKMDKNTSGMIHCTWSLVMYISFYHEMFL